MNWTVHGGDCLEVMKTIEADSIDALVSDPPAGIGFMQAKWDSDKGGRDEWIKWMNEVMSECLRVMKPGAHGLVWALPRTSHWTATALEDAGFRVIDSIQHVFGSGFPKSLNIKKSAEKQGIACVCREEMPDLQSRMDSENALPGDSEPNVLTRMCGRSGENHKTHSNEEPSCLSPVWQNILESQQSTVADEILHSEVRRCNAALASGVCCSPSGNCTQGAEGLDCPEPCQLSAVNGRGEQSGMEGRRDVQAKQGKLHRTEVCAMPGTVSSDGAERRLRDGASVGDGDAYGAGADQDRSGASQGPQHEKQRDREPGMVSRQPITQACGRCGKTRFAEGYGSALKPAVEIWWLVQKPISERNIALNVLKHGTGGINIDGSRIEAADQAVLDATVKRVTGKAARGWKNTSSAGIQPVSAQGRFPANLVFSHTPYCLEDQCDIECAIKMLNTQANQEVSRFFYVAKISSSERNAGLEEMPDKELATSTGQTRPNAPARLGSNPDGKSIVKNNHPTVKPQKLMRYLIKLITPPGGTVLDPFAGSGSTGVAAITEGFNFIGIEKEPEYVAIAKVRMIAAEARP